MKTKYFIFLFPALIALNTVSNLYNGLSYKTNFNICKLDNDYQNITLEGIDAAVDEIIPLNHVYTQQEAIDLRKNLEQELQNNPTSIIINWALIRYYTCAPNFVGGNRSAAIQHAAYIYSLNKYIGCLGYEYVYSRSNQLVNAENWYKHSLSAPLPKNMLWQDIKYNKTVQSNLKIVGNFNNWKTQYMYENGYGTYNRRVMTPKCENCKYKVIVDDMINDIPTKAEFIVAG